MDYDEGQCMRSEGCIVVSNELLGSRMHLLRTCGRFQCGIRTGVGMVGAAGIEPTTFSL